MYISRIHVLLCNRVYVCLLCSYIIKSCWQRGFLGLYLSICPYRRSLQVGPPDVLTSSVILSIMCLSYMRDGRYVAGKPLFSWVVLPEFVQSSSQRSCQVFTKRFDKVQMVQLYNITDDFHRADNQSIAAHAFPMPMLTPLSVEEILIPRYVKWSTNFKVL